MMKVQGYDMIPYLFLFLYLAGLSCGKEPPDCSICQQGSLHCQILSGIFLNPELTYGYNKVTDVPAGACFLRVTQITESNNMLALRRPGDKSLTTNDTMLISLEGPLPYPVEIVVLIEEPNRGIQYEYRLPISSYDSSSISNRRVPPKPLVPDVPLLQEAQAPSTASTQHPTSKRKKNRRKKGRKRNRKYKWNLTGYGPCDATCGEGVEPALFQCIREGRRKKVVKERKCRKAELPSAPYRPCGTLPTCPPQREPSNDNVIYRRPTGKWNIGTWSHCSTQCGEGIKTRNVDCISIENGGVVPENECNGSQRPATLSTCNGNQCHLQNPQWMYTEWEGECDSTNHVALQQRDAICSGEECVGQPKKTNACNTDDGVWFTGPWSSCSVTCGEGVQHRPVLCMQEGQFLQQSESLCNVHAKPDRIRPCSMATACDAGWITSEWIKCENDACFKRHVLCFDSHGKISQQCSLNERPSLSVNCNIQSCNELEFLSTKEEVKPKENKRNENSLQDSSCTDRRPECKIVVKARLCRLEFYRKACCSSCKKT